MAKPGKKPKKAATRGAACAFCPAQIDLYGKTWDERRKEFEDAGWSSVKVQTKTMRWPEGYNGCPKCGDRLGPGPIDHEVSDRRR